MTEDVERGRETMDNIAFIFLSLWLILHLPQTSLVGPRGSGTDQKGLSNEILDVYS